MSNPRTGFVVAVVLAMGGAAVLMRNRSHQAVPTKSPVPVPASARVTDGGSSTVSVVSAVSSAESASLPDHVALHPDSEALCPEGMVYVEGSYCPFVAFRCAAYLGTAPEPSKGHEAPDEARRCGRYHNELMCEGRPIRLKYCIDEYEYPNISGAKPAVMVDYRQARQACRAENKRICEIEEWTYACEGSRTWPYPYGIERDPGACNIDRRPRQPNQRALSMPFDVSVEIERLDQRVAAGALPGCVSPFGVMDMTGNVAEWVHDREAEERDLSNPASLAGGHWARVPATCRGSEPSRSSRSRSHRVGFRCCRGALDGRRARGLAPKEARLPRRRALLP